LFLSVAGGCTHIGTYVGVGDMIDLLFSEVYNKKYEKGGKK
jgi:hypothetical protein